MRAVRATGSAHAPRARGRGAAGSWPLLPPVPPPQLRRELTFDEDIINERHLLIERRRPIGLFGRTNRTRSGTTFAPTTFAGAAAAETEASRRRAVGPTTSAAAAAASTGRRGCAPEPKRNTRGDLSRGGRKRCERTSAQRHFRLVLGGQRCVARCVRNSIQKVGFVCANLVGAPLHV